MCFLEQTLWIFFGVVLSLMAVVLIYFKWKYQYWRGRKVPYLEPSVPFGNLKDPFSVTFSNRLVDMYKKAKVKGWKYCGVYLMISPTLLVLDLDLAKHILAKDFQYFTDRGIYTNEKVDPIGCHLFALGGTRWKNVRSKLTPAFTSGKLKNMFQTLLNCGLVLEKHLKDNVRPEDPVDIKGILANFSMDVIASCAFGLDCNSFKKPNCLFRSIGKDLPVMTKWKIVRILFVQNFPKLAQFLGIPQIPKDTAMFFTKVVEDMVEYREKNGVARKDFVQLLIDIKNMKGLQKSGQSVSDDGKSLTMQEIVAQCFVFFIAGYETTSSAMTFALFELAMHPEVQERLRDEINTVLAKNGGKITYDSLSEMKYMGQVVDETLRLHLPLQFVHRVCVSDYKVPGESLIIERGTRIFLPTKGIHYDEDYWKNPNVFDPDRFSEEKRKKMNAYTYLPFGQGPRICIGERFALMEVRVGLTCILGKFRAKLNEKTKLPLTASLKTIFAAAEGGIWLNLERL